MAQLYDELDENGNIVASNIRLRPGMSLPEGHKWTEHIITLDEAKLVKWTEIETLKSDLCFRPVSALGHTWQADNRSQTLLTSALVLTVIGAAPCPTIWRSMDNIDVPVTLDQLKVLSGTMAYATQQAYSASWVFKNQLQAATSVEEVNNIIVG